MGNVRWIIFVAAVILLIGGLVVWSRYANPSIDVSNVNGNAVIAAGDLNGNIGDHTFNDTQSDVVLIEYGDFQCPGCRSAFPNVKTLLSDYDDKITFIFRNFPLKSIHPNALAAAAAAEAAGLQGQYWAMHDTLFQNQTTWQGMNSSQRTDTFKTYAEQLNLDVARFESDLASDAVADKIAFDEALGQKANVSSTPTFVLNGEILPEEASRGILNGDLTEIEKLLDEKLQ
jgi:protein-disulfide isomerase